MYVVPVLLKGWIDLTEYMLHIRKVEDSFISTKHTDPKVLHQNCVHLFRIPVNQWQKTGESRPQAIDPNQYVAGTHMCLQYFCKAMNNGSGHRLGLHDSKQMINKP